MLTGEITNVAPDVLKEPLSSRFAPYSKLYEKPAAERGAPPVFIHLLNPQCQMGQHIFSIGTAWRGRLSQVSGFHLGQRPTL